MNAKFEKGSLVRRKSGGPKMTVSNPYTDEFPPNPPGDYADIRPEGVGANGCPAGWVECKWWDEKKGEERICICDPDLLEDASDAFPPG